MSAYGFQVDQNGDITVAGLLEWAEFMAEQSEMQTLLLKQICDREGATLNDLREDD